ncbi:MAG: endonuclease/exonuclease/phosphatase family protein [Planctomycetota bacterium]|nr:endonuclease/exonuclease/phosphatase family protein [Planctomycetota bacterium]
MPTSRLRVLTWNLLEGGMDGRLEGILRHIRSVRPDVVALQECNGWHARGEKLLRHAARTLKMQAFPYWTQHGYQPAILTRVNGAEAIAHDDQDPFHLGYQELRLPLPGGRTWHFFNTHLNPFEEKARLVEMRTLTRVMKPYRSGFCSLTGDLNSVAEGDTYLGVRLKLRNKLDLNRNAMIRSRFEFVGLSGLYGYGDVKNPTAWMRIPVRVRRMKDFADVRTEVIAHLRREGWIDGFRKLHPREDGHTIPSTIPEGRIDYVWLSPALARRLTRCEVMYGRKLAKLSDHCPILWEVSVD